MMLDTKDYYVMVAQGSIFLANFCQLDLKCTAVVSVTSVHVANASGYTRQLYINQDDFTPVILVLWIMRILPRRSVLLLLQLGVSLPPFHVCISVSSSL